MKRLSFLLLLFVVVACSKDDQTINLPVLPESTEASLLSLTFEEGSITYPTIISGTTVSLSESLPYGTESVTIQELELSPRASSDFAVGDRLSLRDSPITLEVTAEDQVIKQAYELVLDMAEPDYFSLLFDSPTEGDCEAYTLLTRNDITVENNVWNAGALTPGSFEQCVFAYEDNWTELIGWTWQYPENATGVNAYPQIIYGWKPWHQGSTTTELPKKLSDINKLEVNYEVETTRNEGNYNLAFDCWINSEASITPQNIQFELMIWEDAHALDPFGDFQETITTSNGSYDFYMGEPTWEPAGSDWIYLAFERTSFRTAGTVDVNEFLTYLIAEGIVPADSYLATVEFGNEVGNSTGRTVVKRFEIASE